MAAAGADINGDAAVDTNNDTKQKLGQFYTTNAIYILQGLTIPLNTTRIVEPFAGTGDLVKFAQKRVSKRKAKCEIDCYDIDPKYEGTQTQDTLLNPPNYDGTFVITNPPYLARNKSTDKTVFDKYKQNDLYKCFLQSLIKSNCSGGILIIPLNFWCSIRKLDVQLRKQFLQKFIINRINIFETQVFNDTSYAVCSFNFKQRARNARPRNINCYVYPSGNKITIKLSADNNYTIGGEIYQLEQNAQIVIERLTKNNKDSDNITNINVKCIDDNSQNKIQMMIVGDDDRYIDNTENLSARSYAGLVITPKINNDQQQELVRKFNEYLEEKRATYYSLFLTNYRESSDIARKRISFSLAFQIANHLLNEILEDVDADAENTDENAGENGKDEDNDSADENDSENGNDSENENSSDNEV